jgi:hypothetical protein
MSLRDVLTHLLAGAITAPLAIAASIPLTGTTAYAVFLSVLVTSMWTLTTLADTVTARRKGGHR